MRLEMPAELTDIIINIGAIGKRRNPAWSGLYPWTDWKYWPRKNNEPNMENMTMAKAMFAPVKDMFLKNRIGIMA